jgi:hypothetical protein
LTKTPTIGALFAAGTAFTFESALTGLTAAGFTETAFAAGTVDALFVPLEIAFVFGLDTAGFTETAFWVDVAGFTAGVAFTETAAFAFGAALAPLAFAPFGEGFPACAVWVVAGCTLTAAGDAGFCTAVGVCANAAADRSMRVPRVRII